MTVWACVVTYTAVRLGLSRPRAMVLGLLSPFVPAAGLYVALKGTEALEAINRRNRERAMVRVWETRVREGR